MREVFNHLNLPFHSALRIFIATFRFGSISLLIVLCLAAAGSFQEKKVLKTHPIPAQHHSAGKQLVTDS